MKYLILISIVITTMGCAQLGLVKEPELTLRDTKNRSKSQHVVDQRYCERYLGFTAHGHPILDQEYYYACMDLKGYKLEEVKAAQQ